MKIKTSFPCDRGTSKHERALKAIAVDKVKMVWFVFRRRQLDKIRNVSTWKSSGSREGQWKFQRKECWLGHCCVTENMVALEVIEDKETLPQIVHTGDPKWN